MLTENQEIQLKALNELGYSYKAIVELVREIENGFFVNLTGVVLNTATRTDLKIQVVSMYNALDMGNKFRGRIAYVAIYLANNRDFALMRRYGYGSGGIAHLKFVLDEDFHPLDEERSKVLLYLRELNSIRLVGYENITGDYVGGKNVEVFRGSKNVV